MVPSDESWIDKELFTIGGVEVTAKDAVISSTVILVIIIIASLICLFISWRKRHAIANGARRASTFIVRQSQIIRNTIKANLGRPVEEIPDIEVDPNKIGRSKHEKEFLKDMFKYQSAVDVFEGNESGVRDSNASNYATGNQLHESLRKNPVSLPGAAEFEIQQLSTAKNLHKSNKI